MSTCCLGLNLMNWSLLILEYFCYTCNPLPCTMYTYWWFLRSCNLRTPYVSILSCNACAVFLWSFLYGFAGFSYFMWNYMLFGIFRFLLFPRFTGNIVYKYFSWFSFLPCLVSRRYGGEIESQDIMFYYKNLIFDHYHLAE